MPTREKIKILLKQPNAMLAEIVQKLPKAELHVHLEGTLEPEQFLVFAQRNKIAVPYTTPDQVRAVLYTFHDLASFIAVYKKVSAVVCTEQDFYDLTTAYLKKAYTQGVLHAEIFVDLQTGVSRTIDPEAVINAMHQAILESTKLYGITASIIVCFVRDLGAESAMKTVQSILPFKDKISAVGLASLEKNYPPAEFKHVFDVARSHGFHTVAHAGEDYGPEYIWQAMDILHVQRIDHGVRCIEDAALMQELARRKLPLTVCPLSNSALGVFSSLDKHPLKKMFDAGLLVTINSDDPAFFNGYIGDNYCAVASSLGFSFDQLVTMARNSFHASFASPSRKKECLALVDSYTLNMRNSV